MKKHATIEERILTIKLYKKLNSLRKTSNLLEIPKSNISRWNNQLYKKIRISKYDHLIPTIIQIISALLISKPFSNVLEIQEHILKNNIKCTTNLIYSVMKKMNYKFKRTKIQYFNNLNDLENKKKVFLEQFKHYQNTKNIENIMVASVDEFSFNKNAFPYYSWSLKGQKTYIKQKIYNNNSKTSVCMILVK